VFLIWPKVPTIRSREECGLLGNARSAPTHWRHKNKTGLFSISCLGRGKGSFREDPGLPFHHAKPALPKDGPMSKEVRTASILSHCLALEAGPQWESGLAWEDATDHLTHSTLLQRTAPGLCWFHKSTCIFSYLLSHSAIIYWAPTRLRVGQTLGIKRRIWLSSWPSRHLGLVMTGKQTPMAEWGGCSG
jgi:hypothetical protein